MGVNDKAMILLAEDNEANVNMMLQYLTAKGYPVVVTRDGAGVIDSARRTTPDLILMDIQMPGVNGLQAIEAIRNDSTLTTVPIIALTALAMPGDRQRCLQAGASEYVKKPARLRHLVEIIETLDRERSGSPHSVDTSLAS